MKRKRLSFKPVPAPITTLTTKFGGVPVWADDPAWPRSRRFDEPMQFLGQVEIDPELFDCPPGWFAYLFMTSTGDPPTQPEPHLIPETWDPGSGENAVVIQSAIKDPPPILRPPEGPLTKQYVWDKGARKPRLAPWEAVVETHDEEEPDDEESLDYASKIGGRPCWLQADETPGEGWRLLLQMHEPSALGCSDTTMNFGTGILYVFLSPDRLRAKMLWQC